MQKPQKRGHICTEFQVLACINFPDFITSLYKFHPMKIDLQLIAAFLLSTGGLILLFCGVFIDPQGEIHSSLLVAFGETATFAGALFGIDYVYKKKN